MTHGGSGETDPLPRPAPLPLVQRHTVSDAWAVNTYTACDIRCTYCITRAQGLSLPRYPADQVADQLRRELDAIGTIDRLSVGPFCDVYPGPEEELGVTRAVLEVLHERGLHFNLITKGTAVLRDVDLLRRPGVVIHMSVCTLDEAWSARYEPGAASPLERLDVLKQLHAAGVATLHQASPWIPDVSDVAALRAAIDPSITTQVTPLRLPTYITRTSALPFTQDEINGAYRAEYERLAGVENVLWSRPPPTDGTPPHTSDNLGRRVIDHWAPAPPAPVPSPGPWAGPRDRSVRLFPAQRPGDDR